MSQNNQTDTRFTAIRLLQFKNYADARIGFSPSFNCLLGLNGMGKTNVLDAIYYLCMGKSYFQASDSWLVQYEQDFFRLEGYLLSNSTTHKVVVKVVPRKSKVLEWDQVAYEKIADHVGRIPVVFICPDDALLAREGSEARRRFVDNTLCQTDKSYLQSLMAYNHVLKQRNALLKQYHQPGQLPVSLLDIYDQQLSQHGSVLGERRRVFAKSFIPFLLEAYSQVSGQREHVDCVYETIPAGLSYQDGMLAAREKDVRLQRTTFGIHRDDLQFLLEEKPLKQVASQGQLKSFVLALKLAQYRHIALNTGKKPILLLDDIFDRLDAERVTRLVELLHQDNFGQVFLSDTGENRVIELLRAQGIHDFRIFHIVNGTVEEHVESTIN